MMLSKINKIALIMIILSFCIAGAGFAYTCSDVISSGDPIRPGAEYYNLNHLDTPVGRSAGYTGLGVYNETDILRDNLGLYEDSTHIVSYDEGWGFFSSTFGKSFLYGFSKQTTTPGTYVLNVVVDDSCTGSGDDPEITIPHRLHAIAPDAIYGPSRWCKNMSVQMCATYTPAGDDGARIGDSEVHVGFLQWYWKKKGADDSTYTRFTNPSHSDDHTKSVCSISFSDPGEYTICVKAQVYENYVYAPSGWNNIVTKDVTVIVPEDVDCDSSGGGGCSSGTCGGGGIGGLFWSPGPDLRNPKVYNSYNPNGPGSSFVKSIETCPIKPVLTMFRYENCNTSAVTYHWHYTSPCGTTSCVDFSASNPYSLGRYGNIQRFGSSESNWTYVATDGAGNKYNFDVAPTSGEENTAPYHGDSKANGGSVSGTIDPINHTLPVYERGSDNITRKTWTYDLSDDNERVTKETHPDGTTVDITYNTGGMPTLVSYSNSPTDLDFNVSYEYDTNGRLTRAVKGDKAVEYAYDTDKITVTETNSSATTDFLVTEYTYGTDTTTVTRKYISTPVDPSKDQTTTYKFFLDALGEKSYVYSETDSLGHIKKNYTNVPTGTTLNGGTLHTDYEIVDYNSCLKGKVFKTIDAANRETSYNWNATTGLLTSVTHPRVAVYGNSNYQPTETYTYISGKSLISAITDISGITTEFLYENTSFPYNVTSVKVDNTVVQQYEYYPTNDAHGQGGMVFRETVPNIEGTTGYIKEYEYYYNETTSQGTVEKLSSSPTKTYYKVWNGTSYDTVSGSYSVLFNTNGRHDTSTDANGRSAINTTSKDELTHEKTTIKSYVVDDKYTMSVYDCCNLLYTADEDGRETHYAHDAIGRVTKAWTDVTGQSEEAPLFAKTYDSFGNISAITTRSDANTSRTTSYTFDKLNRVKRIDYPSPLGYEEYGYDAVGNMWYKRDGNGSKTLYQYDNLNRLIKIYYNYTGALGPDDTPNYTGLTASVTYLYRNGGSQLYSITDSSAGTSEYEYDTMGRLHRYKAPNMNRSVYYTYNNLGQKTSVTNGSFVTNYEYYANGWLKNVKRGTSLIVSYTYDNVGNRTRLTYGNGSYENFDYEDTDPRYRLEGIDYAYRCDAGSPIANQGGLDFTRDKKGNPLTWGSDEYTKSYGYDNNSRLTSANYPGHVTETWSYDWVGNRTNTNYTYNTADQLTASPNKAYTYDGAGNLTAITGTGAKTFTYTPNNLVSTIQHNGGATSSMVWDVSGNRISFTSSTGGTYNYLYDITTKIPAVIEEVTPVNSVYYVRDPEGTLLARVEGSTIQYYHFDELGNTIFMTDSNAVVTDRYTYDAWGNVTSHTGSTNQPYQYVGQFGYYTHYQDSNLPYIQTGVRLFNTEVGRYMQLDPIKFAGGLNQYRYAADNSMTNIDPSGLRPMGPFEKGYFCLKEYICLRTVMDIIIGVPATVISAIGAAYCLFAGPAWAACFVPFESAVLIVTSVIQAKALFLGLIYYTACLSQECPQPYCATGLANFKKSVDDYITETLRHIDDMLGWRKDSL